MCDIVGKRLRFGPHAIAFIVQILASQPHRNNGKKRNKMIWKFCVCRYKWLPYTYAPRRAAPVACVLFDPFYCLLVINYLSIIIRAETGFFGYKFFEILSINLRHTPFTLKNLWQHSIRTQNKMSSHQRCIHTHAFTWESATFAMHAFTSLASVWVYVYVCAFVLGVSFVVQHRTPAKITIQSVSLEFFVFRLIFPYAFNDFQF